MSIYMYNTKHSLNKQTKSKTKLCSAKPKHLTSSGWLAGSSLTTGCRALLFDFLAASGQSWRIRTGVSHGICIVNSCRTSRVWLFLHFDINPHVPLSWIPHPFHSHSRAHSVPAVYSSERPRSDPFSKSPPISPSRLYAHPLHATTNCNTPCPRHWASRHIQHPQGLASKGITEQSIELYWEEQMIRANHVGPCKTKYVTWERTGHNGERGSRDEISESKQNILSREQLTVSWENAQHISVERKRRKLHMELEGIMSKSRKIS